MSSSNGLSGVSEQRTRIVSNGVGTPSHTAPVALSRMKLSTTVGPARLSRACVCHSVCAKSGRGELTARIEREMRAANVPFSLKTYNALIAACKRDKQLPRAVALLRHMREQTIAPTTVTYAAMMSVYARSGDHAGARRMFTEMRRDGIAPTLVTFNTLTSAYAAAGEVRTLRGFGKTRIWPRGQFSCGVIHWLVGGALQRVVRELLA